MSLSLRLLGVRFEYQCDRPPEALSDARRLVLYRCTRELLVNVIKHAQATSVSVTLSVNEGHVRVRVEDDGAGFEASEAGKGFSPSGGFGLFNVSEHMQHTQGDLTIESAPGRGTRVTMDVPLEKEL